MSAAKAAAKRALPLHAGLPAVVRSSEALAGVFAALGDPTRLRLVAVLCAGGAFSIAQLTAQTEISRQGVTKHLQVLADAGVVRDAKLGRERLWQLLGIAATRLRKRVAPTSAAAHHRRSRAHDFAGLHPALDRRGRHVGHKVRTPVCRRAEHDHRVAKLLPCLV